MSLVFRYTSLLAAAPLLFACESQRPYDPTDYSGHACDDTPGVACVWAGVPGIQGFGSQKISTQGDGQPINESWLDFPIDLSFGPDGLPYVLDWNNHRVRVVTTDGKFKTVIGTGQEGDGPPNKTDEMPYDTAPGCDPTTVQLNHPTQVAWAPDGTLVLDAWHDNKIRVIDPTTHKLKVLAGGGYGFAGDGGPSWRSLFNQEKSIAIDSGGRIYVNDQRNERIRMIDVDANRTIDTIAGTGTLGYAGDGGPALQAEFGWDNGGAPDPSGALLLQDDHHLLIADSFNDRIRVMDLDAGTISCLAGDFDGCTLRVALDYPVDLDWGPDGRLYVVERDGNVVDALDLGSGALEHVVGNGQACTATPCIEKGSHVAAREVQLNQPYGIAFDPKGNLYVADQLNNRILRVAK